MNDTGNSGCGGGHEVDFTLDKPVKLLCLLFSIIICLYTIQQINSMHIVHCLMTIYPCIVLGMEYGQHDMYTDIGQA